MNMLDIASALMKASESDAPESKKDAGNLALTFTKEVLEPLEQWAGELAELIEACEQAAGDLQEADSDDRESFHESFASSAADLHTLLTVEAWGSDR